MVRKSYSPAVLFFGFVAGGVARLAEFVFTRGITVRAKLKRDSQGERHLEVNAQLNAFDENGDVRSNTEFKNPDPWRRS
jgi:hypothetical protein